MDHEAFGEDVDSVVTKLYDYSYGLRGSRLCLSRIPEVNLERTFYPLPDLCKLTL